MLSLATVLHWLKSRQVILLLLLILAVGIFLRVYDLGVESIWLDEASGIRLSTQGVASIMERVGPTQNHPPLYFLILHFWMGLFGTSEVATRSLSAVAGIISILLIYQVGTVLFNRKVGLISGFLSAISSYHIYYSQEARSYSLLLLLSLLSYLLFIAILKWDKKWYYPCYFLTNLALGYTHFYGLFIIASQIIYFLLFWDKYRLQRVKFFSTVAVTILAFLPLMSLLVGRGASLAQHGFWIPKPRLVAIFNTFDTFAGSAGAKEFILLAFLLLAIIGLFSIKIVARKWSWKKPLESLKGLSWSIRLDSIGQELLLIIWLFTSIIVPFIESKFMTPIYLTRYMTGASPAFYLLVARGMGNLNRKWVFYPVLIFIILLSSFGLQLYYKDYTKAQWREAANFVELNSRVDSDVIVFCASFCRTPFNYYYKGSLPQFRIGTNVGKTKALDTFVDDAVDGKDRLWLVLGHGGQMAPIRTYLRDRYGSRSIIVREEFFGVSVLLFDLSPP